MSATRAHVFVTGRVQGVWFRESTRQRAEELGVGGWVRNLPDGRVEALFEGNPEAVKQAVEYVREGPRHAQVQKVELVELIELVEPTEDVTQVPSPYFRVR